MGNKLIRSERFFPLRPPQFETLILIQTNEKRFYAKEALAFLSDFFLSTYMAELRDFKGDVRPFKNFDEKLRESMDYHWILT
nr:hypothetical protein [Candidatus Sigynarchaeum springense]